MPRKLAYLLSLLRTYVDIVAFHNAVGDLGQLRTVKPEGASKGFWGRVPLTRLAAGYHLSLGCITTFKNALCVRGDVRGVGPDGGHAGPVAASRIAGRGTVAIVVVKAAIPMISNAGVADKVVVTFGDAIPVRKLLRK